MASPKISGDLAQRETRHRPAGCILDLQPDTAGRRGGEVQLQLLTLKYQRFGHQLAPRQGGVDRNESVDPETETTEVHSVAAPVVLDGVHGQLHGGRTQMGCRLDHAPGRVIVTVYPIGGCGSGTDERFAPAMELDPVTAGHEERVGNGGADSAATPSSELPDARRSAATAWLPTSRDPGSASGNP